MSLRSSQRPAGNSQAELREVAAGRRTASPGSVAGSFPLGPVMVRRRPAMPSRLRTPRSDLDRLPQFEPDHTFRLDETQHESGLPFPESRARQIRDVLSSAMKDHVRKARFQGKSTSLERFLGNAMLAIATYESRSLRRRAYDRGRASKLLKEVRVALWAFQRALERTVEWKQLDRYLDEPFCRCPQAERAATRGTSGR